MLNVQSAADQYSVLSFILEPELILNHLLTLAITFIFIKVDDF